MRERIYWLLSQIFKGLVVEYNDGTRKIQSPPFFGSYDKVAQRHKTDQQERFKLSRHIFLILTPKDRISTDGN